MIKIVQRFQRFNFCKFGSKEADPKSLNVAVCSFLFKEKFHKFCQRSICVNKIISSPCTPAGGINLNLKEDENTNKSVIYYGQLTGQIKGVKVFTIISSIGGLVIQPMILQNIINGENVPLGLALCTTVGFFTFVTPVLIHLFTRKYVTEIKYDHSSDTYTATTISFFLQNINTKFRIEDVAVPSSLPLFTTMYIKGKPLFVISDSFLVPSHYIKMMGYDKPIDLKLNNSAEAIESRTSTGSEK